MIRLDLLTPYDLEGLCSLIEPVLSVNAIWNIIINIPRKYKVTHYTPIFNLVSTKQVWLCIYICIVDGWRTFQPQALTPDLSTLDFQPWTFQPWIFQPQNWGCKVRGWGVLGWKFHGWKVWGWKLRGWKVHGWKVRCGKVWGWSLGLESLGLKCLSTTGPSRSLCSVTYVWAWSRLTISPLPWKLTKQHLQRKKNQLHQVYSNKYLLSFHSSNYLNPKPSVKVLRKPFLKTFKFYVQLLSEQGEQNKYVLHEKIN